MRIPDTFVLVQASGQRSISSSDPQIVLFSGKKYGKCRLVLTSPVLRAIGYVKGQGEMFFQAFVSSQTIKLVMCKADAPGARKLTSSGYISHGAIADWFQLKDGMTFRCKAEVVKGKVPEIWATFPAELRDHIEAINGMVG